MRRVNDSKGLRYAPKNAEFYSEFEAVSNETRERASARSYVPWPEEIPLLDEMPETDISDLVRTYQENVELED